MLIIAGLQKGPIHGVGREAVMPCASSPYCEFSQGIRVVMREVPLPKLAGFDYENRLAPGYRARINFLCRLCLPDGVCPESDSVPVAQTEPIGMGNPGLTHRA